MLLESAPGKNIGSDALPKSAFYNETDLHVGSYVRVYNRDLLLHDCDEFTKNYYMSKYKMTEDMLESVDVQVSRWLRIVH